MEQRLIHRWYGRDAKLYFDGDSEAADRGTLTTLDAWEDPVVEHWRIEIVKMFLREAELRAVLEDLMDDEEKLLSGDHEFNDVEHEVRLLEIDRRDINKKLDMYRIKRVQLHNVIKRFGAEA